MIKELYDSIESDGQKDYKQVVRNGITMIVRYFEPVDSIGIDCFDSKGQMEWFRVEPVTHKKDDCPSGIFRDADRIEKDDYSFARIYRLPYGNGSKDDYEELMYGDYKDWTVKELCSIMNDIFEDVSKVAKYRLCANELARQYASAAREPDLNVMETIHKALIQYHKECFGVQEHRFIKKIEEL